MKNDRHGKYFLGVYVLLSIVHCILVALEQDNDHDPGMTANSTWTKPLLMPCLAVYFYTTTIRRKDFTQVPRTKVFLALLFAFKGDVLLMLEAPNDPHTEELFFLSGLTSFLVMQILYCLIFDELQRETEEESSSLLHRQPYLALPVVAFGFGFYALAFPKLDDVVLKVGVLIYASALSSMVLFALQRFGQTTLKSFWTVFVGAAMFAVSDSLIGINRFIMETPMASLCIMATYTFAQGLIVWGIVKHQQPKPTKKKTRKLQ
jgi:uncharacterized membrane protein YhhN